MIVALTDRQWRAVVEATGTAEKIAAVEKTLGLDFRKEGDRFAARDTLNPLIASWIAARPYAEIARVFTAKGVLFADTLEVEEDNFDVEAEIAKIKKPKSKLGDVYQLGSHRIACGDSLDPEIVKCCPIQIDFVEFPSR